MNIIYAFQDRKLEVKTPSGTTVFVFEPSELETVEVILFQLLSLVPSENRSTIWDAIRHVRVRHTSREIQ